MPCRLRVKSPTIKNNAEAEYSLTKILCTFYGISTVDINLTIGSVLNNYNKNIDRYKDILALLQRKCYFDPSKTVTNDQYIQNAASKVSLVISLSQRQEGQR